jgi:hypothetical protein
MAVTPQQINALNQYLSEGIPLADALVKMDISRSDIIYDEDTNQAVETFNMIPGTNSSGNDQAEILGQAENARQQASIGQNISQWTNQGDWRVKIRLGGLANYLYKDPFISNRDLLWPVKQTDGVIFPYTPQISTTYGANYTNYDLTHSNFRGYFYQNSYIDEVSISATFTAQDTQEADYMLAVIHFFRSASKMFYGQDALRGVPPPLLYLSGFGEFQFNDHPCLLRTFSYDLPDSVDYIKARTRNVNNNSSIPAANQRTLSTVSASTMSTNRLLSSGLQFGADSSSNIGSFFSGYDSTPTYVPTELKVQLGLLPTQTREQISTEFSLTEYARGTLVKRGFW